MQYLISVQCPDCGAKWRIPKGEEFPAFCPKNGCQLSVPDPDFVPSRMNIRSVQSQSADYTFRKYEADSIARAEQAKPMIEQQLVDAGLPREEAQRQAEVHSNELKVTNLRDNIREGETAAVPVSNTVTHVQDAMSAAGMWQGNFQGGFAGAASAGPAPFHESGAKSMFAIQAGKGGGGQAPAPAASVAGLSAGFGRAG